MARKWSRERLTGELPLISLLPKTGGGTVSLAGKIRMPHSRQPALDGNRTRASIPRKATSTREERRAVFFDRDGTLNEEVGYVNHLERLQVFPFAGGAVRMVNRAGLLAIVISNQSGVARGLFEESLVKKVHQQLRRKIAAGGGKLDDILYCPHHPQGVLEEYRVQCACRKPSPGLLETAATRYGINLSKSFVVGDRYVDVQLAHRVGAQSVLVLTGYGRGEWEFQRAAWKQQPDHVAANVYEAVRWILSNRAIEPPSSFGT